MSKHIVTITAICSEIVTNTCRYPGGILKVEEDDGGSLPKARKCLYVKFGKLDKLRIVSYR